MHFKKYAKFIILFFCFSNVTLADDHSHSQKEAIEFYQEGTKLVLQRKYEESIDAFNKAIQRVPKFMQAYYAKSNVFGELGKHKEAISTCDEALKLNEKQPRILAQKSFAQYSLGRYKESLDTAQLSVKYGTNISLPYEARANAYAILGKYKLAIEDYDKSLSLAKDPNNSFYDETYLNRFCPLYSLKRYEEALATCDKALEITDNPENLPQIYSKRASALNKLGRYEEALEYSDKALKVNSKDSLAIKEKKMAKSNLKKSTWF